MRARSLLEAREDIGLDVDTKSKAGDLGIRIEISSALPVASWVDTAAVALRPVGVLYTIDPVQRTAECSLIHPKICPMLWTAIWKAPATV